MAQLKTMQNQLRLGKNAFPVYVSNLPDLFHTGNF